MVEVYENKKIRAESGDAAPMHGSTSLPVDNQGSLTSREPSSDTRQLAGLRSTNSGAPELSAKPGVIKQSPGPNETSQSEPSAISTEEALFNAASTAKLPPWHQPYDSVLQFCAKHKLILPQGKQRLDWRLTLKAFAGEINGLHNFRGKAIATNGILVAMEASDGKTIFIGHVEWFIADDWSEELLLDLPAAQHPRKPRYAVGEIDMLLE